MPSSPRSRSLIALFFTTCAFLVQTTAQVRSLETAELTRQADVVVVGRVSDVRSAWNREKTRIQTTATVAVDQVVKGNAGAGSIAIITPGGEVDGVGEYYSHMARFRKDEEVVVFARKDSEGRLRVAAGEQGKLAVKRDDATGVRTVAGDATLEAFVARVRDADRPVTK
jgi:hypothetical protein